MKFKSKADTSVYSLEALKLASYILDEWQFKISTFGEIEVDGENPEKGFKELLNEALNQQCRIDLASKNSKIANIIITKAVLSALGEKEANK
ncbi:MAG: hypothetical protein GX447_02470 [Elusimicrobia bacterium]|nr:hypothetical protein [Elusimicrobiota bacterium]